MTTRRHMAAPGICRWPRHNPIKQLPENGIWNPFNGFHLSHVLKKSFNCSVSD